MSNHSDKRLGSSFLQTSTLRQDIRTRMIPRHAKLKFLFAVFIAVAPLSSYGSEFIDPLSGADICGRITLCVPDSSVDDSTQLELGTPNQDPDQVCFGESPNRERGPAVATRWRVQAMRDEHGRIPDDARLKALQQLEMNLAYARQRKFAPGAPVWTAQGPFDRGGRARSLVVHPDQPQILWAAAGSGGLWKSEDSGASWRPLADKLGLPAGSLVMDPRNPQILYFGTGERWHTGGPGAGIYVTRDGGSTWKRLSSTRLWRYVPAIAISPSQSNIIIASVDDPESPTRSGVYRSTNAGQSWTRVLQISRMSPYVIRFQPRSSARVLLAVRDGLFPSGRALVMYSDDAGITWHRSNGIGTSSFTRYEIAYSPSQPQIAYATSRDGVYKSSDGGVSFSKISAFNSYGPASWTGTLWVSPTNSNIVYVGGVSLARSRDGGSNWEEVNYRDWDRDIGHLDFQMAVADPNFNGGSNRRIYLLNDGGIDRINDAHAKPIRRHAETLDHDMQTMEFYAVAGTTRDNLILGGAQDRGIIRTHAGTAKSNNDIGGDGACVLIDPSDNRYQYGCGQLLWIVRLQPNGWIGLTNDLPDSFPDVGEVTANFIAPVLLDPNAPHRMIAGGASLWRSENVRNATHDAGRRARWVEIKPSLPAGILGSDRHIISAIAIAKGDSNDIWVAHNDGRMFRTRNGLSDSPTWNVIDDNALINPLPPRMPLDLMIDRTNRRRVYASFGGFSSDNLWRTDDGGTTWRKASGRGATALPSAPVWSIAQHPTKPNTIVAGTEVGLYISNNNGNTWTAIRAPFTAAAQDVSFMQNSTTLIVGTFGRGLWTVNID